MSKRITFASIAEAPKPSTSRTLVPEDSSTRPEANLPPSQPIIKEPVSDTLVPDRQSTLVPESKFYRKPNGASDLIDRHLSPAESKVFDHLWRLIVGFNTDRRQLRVKTICDRTGYRSMKTVRIALFGLESKGLIMKISRHNDPLGDEYVIVNSSTRVPEYQSPQVKNSGVLESKTTRELKTSIKNSLDDDEPAALIRAAFEITGKKLNSSEWKELFELLAAELKIAAARTTVSDVPAFLTEHLRRRLFKKERAEMEADIKPQAESGQGIDISQCPDCGGSGMYYPQGYESGVAKCKHLQLSKS